MKEMSNNLILYQVTFKDTDGFDRIVDVAATNANDAIERVYEIVSKGDIEELVISWIVSCIPINMNNITNRVNAGMSPKVSEEPLYNLIDVILAWDLGFCRSRAIQLIYESQFKNPSSGMLQSRLERAKWYLDKALQGLAEK